MEFIVRKLIGMIWNFGLKEAWGASWKTKILIVLVVIYFMLSIPTVPLGSWTGYHLIGYFQNRNRTKNLTTTIEPDMYELFNLTALSGPRFTAKINFIRDSLLIEGYCFSEFIPRGLDSISIRPYYNFDSRDGIALVDFFLSCGCSEGSGKMRLFEIAINTDNLDYQIVCDIDVPWNYYLNPWADFLKLQRGGKDPGM